MLYWAAQGNMETTYLTKSYGTWLYNTQYLTQLLLWKEVVKNVGFKMRFPKDALILHSWLLKTISAIKVIIQTEPKTDWKENVLWF